MSKIITCEQVSNGHPDKICDQIADAIVTDCLKHDPKSRVAIECLIKDNHIEAAGGIENVMERCLDLPYSMKVEVEVENAHDAEVAAKCGADIIMLDNRTPEEAKELYALIKSIDPDIMVEVSGRVTMDNLGDYADCADRISMGALTHSVKAAHFSLALLNRS